jgi:NADPH-dependent 2,4-dienoyl-CoA reductase/sulfur reductase-like enzyme
VTVRPCSTLALVAMVACAGRPAPVAAPPPVTAAACAVGDTAMVRDVVYFGHNRPGGGTVSDADWRRFLDEVLTPRFPYGLTVVDATGQWRGRSGMVEQERSEIVTVFHAGDVASRQAIAEVAGEYKRRFQQEAVLRERSSTCARFE